jgi:hypothetical protein
MRISIEGYRAASHWQRKTPTPADLIPRCRGSNPTAPGSRSKCHYQPPALGLRPSTNFRIEMRKFEAPRVESLGEFKF